jgi:hypothetical protein
MKMIQRLIPALTTLSLLAGAASGIAQPSAGYPTVGSPPDPLAVAFGEMGWAGVVSGYISQPSGPPGSGPVTPMYEITGGFLNWNGSGGSLLPGICYDFAGWEGLGPAGYLVVDAPAGVTSPFQYQGNNVAAVISFTTGVNNGVQYGTIGGIATFYDFVNSGTLASETSYFPTINPLHTLVLQDNYPGPGNGVMYTPTIGQPGYNSIFGSIPYYFILGAISWPQSAIPQVQGIWGPPADHFSELNGVLGPEWNPFLPVPEPNTMTLLLLPFGLGVVQQLRKKYRQLKV